MQKFTPTHIHPGAARSDAIRDLLESRNDYARCKAQVISDLKDMNPDMFIDLGSNGKLVTVKQLIHAVEADTDDGKKHVLAYMNALERIAEHRMDLAVF